MTFLNRFAAALNGSALKPQLEQCMPPEECQACRQEAQDIARDVQKMLNVQDKLKIPFGGFSPDPYILGALRIAERFACVAVKNDLGKEGAALIAEEDATSEAEDLLRGMGAPFLAGLVGVARKNSK